MNLQPLRAQLYRQARCLLDDIAPRSCRLCDLPSDTDYALCNVCRGKLILNQHACRRCALPLNPPGQSTGPGPADQPLPLCPECLVRPPAVSRVIAPFVYDPALAWLVHCWKYRREQRLATTFAGLWLWAVNAPPEIDQLVPIPLHWRRLLLRGFNQSADLLDALRPGLGTAGQRRHRPALTRPRPGIAQARSVRSRRLRQLRGAFQLRGTVEDRRIALIDDICTTGATANSAAQTLLEAGAREVQLWCLARTPKS